MVAIALGTAACYADMFVPGNSSWIEFLEVEPQTVACNAWWGPTTCLQVRRVPRPPSLGPSNFPLPVLDEPQTGHLFVGEISGFSFAPGFNYTLEIIAHHTDEPMADASSVTYVLLKVVSKQPAP